MKKRILLLGMLLCVAGIAVGCGNKEKNTDEIAQRNEADSAGMQESDSSADSNTSEIVGAENGEIENQKEANEETDTSQATTEQSNESDNGDDGEKSDTALDFEELSKWQYDFCSGAGGWGEEFTIERDGYFSGTYHDSEMGVVGEEYPNGTYYCCNYSGHLTDLTQINEYTYEMTLSDITYQVEPEITEILDGVQYCYTTSYFWSYGDVYRVYLPGTPLSELSESDRTWINMTNAEETELSMVVIVGVDSELACYSMERLPALEAAEMKYNTYKESYDYFAKQLETVAVTTLDMSLYSGKMYENSDECLNYIWNLVRYNVNKETYEKILAEQREWIAEKEKKASEFDMETGGTLAAVECNMVLGDMTMERCKELVECLRDENQ